MAKQHTPQKVTGLLRSIAAGVTGFMIYQASCGMSEAYCEHLLYDPIIRIAKDKNWDVSSQFIVDQTHGRGDHKRMDFSFKARDKVQYGDMRIGLEVKWIDKKIKNVVVKKDIDKLKKYIADATDAGAQGYGYILIVGLIDDTFKLKGWDKKANIYTYFKSGNIKYGANIYKI